MDQIERPRLRQQKGVEIKEGEEEGTRRKVRKGERGEMREKKRRERGGRRMNKKGMRSRRRGKT